MNDASQIVYMCVYACVIIQFINHIQCDILRYTNYYIRVVFFIFIIIANKKKIDVLA